jgi:ABC-type transporter Mla subunit MlaD
MFAQNSIERELYEGRLKVQRDMATWEAERRLVRREIDEMSQQLDQTTQQLDQTTQQLDQTTQQLDQTTQQLDQTTRRLDEALLRRIQFCERLLQRPVSDAGASAGHSFEQLQVLADRLEQEVTDHRT